MDEKLNKLLRNIHLNLPSPTEKGRSYLVRGDYLYYHYKCDGLNDVGYGCGYRTLQTLCSWIKLNTTPSNVQQNIPTIHEIQRILIEIGDKPESFYKSREWIGSFEICFVIDKIFNVSCKMLHMTQEQEIKTFCNTLKTYFEDFGGIIMMGGEKDYGSKGICGIHITEDDNEIYLLAIDPHFSRAPKSIEVLWNEGYVAWKSLKEFYDFRYFYNLCLPQIKSTT